MGERYYQTKKEFTAVVRSIYISASCDLYNYESDEYQQYVCERVFTNDRTQRLLWEMAEYDRSAKIHTHHMAISLKWLKETDAPEYRAVQLLQKHTNKLAKFVNIHVPKIWDSVKACCSPSSDASVDLQDVCDLYQRQISLSEEFDEIGVDNYMFIARNSIQDSVIYSIHALNKAKEVMEDFQRKLISDPDWQKTMDISFGEELQYPLSVPMAKKLIKIYFPTHIVL